MPAANALMLTDGFKTFVTLQNEPTIKLYEKEVTPPGFGNGGAIDITTMRNTAWRTSAPKKLKSAQPVKGTYAYATEVLPLVQTQLGVNQLITVRFPDASHLQFWGWLDEFQPSQHAEGAQPTAACTFIPSLISADTGEEVAPLYIAPGESA